MSRLLLCLFAATLCSVLVSSPVAAQIAVRGATVHTMEGAPLQDGVVLVRDGKIERVGPAARVRVPDGYRVLEAAVVTPGLIDAHSVVGLAGYFNSSADQDQLETSDPLQPELRAIDAYNAREELVAWVRGLGVTTIHTGHGPGALMSGQTMVVKTSGESVAEALVDSVAMLAMTLGPSVENRFKSPGTRAKSVAMIRQKFLQAQEYQVRRQGEEVSERPARDLGLETLTAVLEGRIPALITAHRVPEIMAALRLAEEFGFRLILDGASEAYLVIDAIKAGGVPVVLHPTMMRQGGETGNASFETAARLVEAGVPVSMQSGFEGYVPKTRVVLFEAAVAAANGLSFTDALATVTTEPARLLGLSDRVGSLAPGKDADLVLFDGDPFEYTTHVCAVLIDGQVVSETCR